MAGHSLGSVITHSYLVRHWADELRPIRVITFGSPIGIITWLWMFLDFGAFDFRNWRREGTFFSWEPFPDTKPAKTPFEWINVVNCLDPIASAFPDDVAHLARTSSAVQADLVGGGIKHRYLGTAKLIATGRAHTSYMHDGDGFLEILRRAAGLGLGEPADVKGGDRGEHWHATNLVLGRAKVAAWWAAFLSIGAYCTLAAWHFQSDWWIVASAAVFLFPAATIGVMAFVQRFVFGVPTKRISRKRIARLQWDPVASPYRFRQLLGYAVAKAVGRKPDPLRSGDDNDDEEVTNKMPAPNPWVRRLRKVIAFVPTLGLMSIPMWLGAERNNWPEQWPSATAVLMAFALFMIYLASCAVYEMLAAWRTVLSDLGLTSASASGTAPYPASPSLSPPPPGAQP